MVKNQELKPVKDGSLWWRPRRGGRPWFWLRRYRTSPAGVQRWWPRPGRRRIWRRRRGVHPGATRSRAGRRPRRAPPLRRPTLVRRPAPNRRRRRGRRPHQRYTWITRATPGGHQRPRRGYHPGLTLVLARGHNNFWGLAYVGRRRVAGWSAGQFQRGSKRGRPHAAVEVVRALAGVVPPARRVHLQLRGLLPRERTTLVGELARVAGWSGRVGLTVGVRGGRPHNGLRGRKPRRG